MKTRLILFLVSISSSRFCPQVSLKKAGKLIQMGVAALAKPPAQKAKHEIKALKSAAHKQALKKLLYGWATVQQAFRVVAVDAPAWPVCVCPRAPRASPRA